MNIDYKVDKTKDNVLIESRNWESVSAIKSYTSKGAVKPTLVTKVLKENLTSKFKGILVENDRVLLTQLISDICKYKEFDIGGNKKYCNIPIMQVLGVFRGSICFENLNMICDKILLKKVKIENFLSIPSKSMVCEVIKTGSFKFNSAWDKLPLKVKVGDFVLIKDNITTEVVLNNETYYATEEGSVVAIFKDSSLNIEEASFINNSIILEPYISNKILGGMLDTPSLLYEDLDYTDIYNQNLFSVLYHDKNIKQVNKKDIVLLDRNITNYVYIGNEKKFILDNLDYLEAKITF